MNQLLEEDTYAAILAKLYYSIKVTERGFLITLVGFNDKLLSLLYAILDHFKEFEKNLEKIKFSAVCDQAKKDYYNQLINPESLESEIGSFLIKDVYR